MRYRSILLSIVSLVTSVCIAQPEWYVQNSGTNRELTDVCFVDQNNGWISGWTGTMLHTTDGGETWNTQDIPPNNAYFSVFFTDAQNGWASGYNGKIVHTSNGGQTWVDQVSPVSTDFYKIYFINSEVGWIAGGDAGTFPNYIHRRTILYTSNGGNSWNAQYNELYESILKSIFFIDQNNGCATGESGIIMKTTDGGNDWSQQTVISSFHFYDVFFANNNNTGWVTGEYLGVPHYAAIYKTTDGGTNWNETPLGTDENLLGLYFTDALHGWAVGGDVNNEAIIYYTSDGGDNWIMQNISVVDALYRVFFLNENSGWAVGHLGTIIATDSQIPVELTSFTATANNNNVTLFWQTATEENNSGFEILRSGNGEEFTEVEFVKGQGTTTKGSDYSYIDKNLQSGNYSYKLVQIDFDGTRNELQVVSIEINSKPTEYALMQNYPNPFNPTTTIEYSVPETGKVSLEVFNITGGKVVNLVNEYKEAGRFKVSFNAAKLPSGVYYYRLKSGQFSSVKKMILLK
jgi:photosystem II stability/assembly factor-like uncharacterized protein